MLRKTFEHLVEFGIFTIALVLFIYFLIQSGYTDTQVVRELINSSGNFGWLIFVLFFIFLALLGISVTPMIILGGVLFGGISGVIVTFISLYLSSIIAFQISSFLHKKLLKKNNASNKLGLINKIVNKLELTVERHCFSTIFFTKFIIANIMVSYALGIINEKVDKKIFFIATFLNNIIVCFVFVFLGGAFIKNPTVIVGVIGFIFSFYLLRRYFVKKHIIKLDA